MALWQLLLFQATTSFAALVVDNSGKGDIFTASKSGFPLFTIRNNGNVLLGGDNATITAPTGLTLQETGDTFGGVALNLQNRNGVNGAMFQQLGTGDLVDFVFAGLSNQRNIRYENRGGQTTAGGLIYQIATPEFEIGAAADPTMMISHIGVGIRKGRIVNSWFLEYDRYFFSNSRREKFIQRNFGNCFYFRSNFFCGIGSR